MYACIIAIIIIMINSINDIHVYINIRQCVRAHLSCCYVVYNSRSVRAAVVVVVVEVVEVVEVVVVVVVVVVIVVVVVVTHFSSCACHPCAGAMLIFSVSFQV